MRTISLFIISAALAACDHSPGPPKTVTVRIPNGNVPLAMFRNESDATWTPAAWIRAGCSTARTASASTLTPRPVNNAGKPSTSAHRS